VVYDGDFSDRRLLAAGAVVAALILMSAGFLLGRLSNQGGHGGNGSAAAPATTPAQAPASPLPSADETVPPVTGAAAGLPGTPTRHNTLGIPVGYPHSRAGAVSACANYVSAYANVRNREPARIRALFRSIALPNVADRLSGALIAIDTQNAKSYGVTSLTSPQVDFNLRVVGYQVRSYTDANSTVAIWSTGGVGLYGSGDDNRKPRQAWGTDICSVSWSGGDWRLADARDGPAEPAITDRAAEGMGRFVYVGGPTA
jgi:hypothetical protein